MVDLFAVADSSTADIGAAVHHQAANHSLGQVDSLAGLALNVDPLLRAGNLDLPLVRTAGDTLGADCDTLMLIEFYFCDGLALIIDGKAVAGGADHREIGQQENHSQKGRQEALILFCHMSALLSLG